MDSDTGLMHYRARWYDAQLGRFISEDPIGFMGGFNWFSYVENNPMNSDDPSGLMGRGGRGPGHDVSLKRDPWEWLRRFLGRRRRFRGADKGHAEQLWVRCRELEKWLSSLISVSLSEENLMKHLFKQYDWCKKKFPTACKNPALSGSGAEQPSTNASQNQSWEGGDFYAVPRWDDGTPLDPVRYPDAYRDHRARQAAKYWGPYMFPINPTSPRIPEIAPFRVPLRPLIVP